MEILANYSSRAGEQWQTQAIAEAFPRNSRSMGSCSGGWFTSGGSQTGWSEHDEAQWCLRIAWEAAKWCSDRKRLGFQVVVGTSGQEFTGCGYL
jgi:hypothetical protein